MISIKQKVRPSPKDVLLALVDLPEPNTTDNINIIDVSFNEDANVTNKSIGIVETLVNGPSGTLQERTYHSDILITDKYGYDFSTAETHPLWYVHYLYEKVYTENISNRVLEVNATNRIEDLIDNGQSIYVKRRPNGEIDVGGTIQVEYDPGTGLVTLNDSNYSIDLSRGAINIVDLVADVNGLTNYKLTYKVITHNISVGELDPSEYQFELSETSTDNVFTGILYLRKDDILSVSYLTKKLSGQELVTESFKPKKLMQQLDNNTTASYHQGSPYYYIGSDNEVVTTLKSYKYFYNIPIYFQPATASNTFIRIDKSHARSVENWYSYYTIGEFSNTTGKYKVYGDRILKRIETAKVTGIKSITLEHEPLFVMIDDQFFDIRITKNTVEMSIDKIEGNVITLEEPIGNSETLFAEYVYYAHATPDKSNDLNPLNAADPYDILNKYHIYLLDTVTAAEEAARTNKFRMISVSKDDVHNSSYNVKPNIQDVLYDYIIGEGLTVNNEMPIGIVSVTNKYTPSVARIIDARYRGGGITYSTNEFDYTPDNYIWHNWDIGRWDGELFDISNYNIFRPDTAMIDSIKSRMSEYDNDVIEASNVDEKDALSTRKALEYIRSKVEKRRPTGSRWMIQYETSEGRMRRV